MGKRGKVRKAERRELRHEAFGGYPGLLPQRATEADIPRGSRLSPPSPLPLPSDNRATNRPETAGKEW